MSESDVDIAEFELLAVRILRRMALSGGIYGESDVRILADFLGQGYRRVVAEHQGADAFEEGVDEVQNRLVHLFLQDKEARLGIVGFLLRDTIFPMRIRLPTYLDKICPLWPFC